MEKKRESRGVRAEKRRKREESERKRERERERVLSVEKGRDERETVR